MSPEQKLAIDQNERLTFDRYGLDPQNPRGRINHPHVSRDYKATRKLMLDDLKSICDWYNAERISPDYNPYTTAASLQHRIISLHPFEDNNGRLSRLLMNWSLETDGCNPSILEEPSDDLFTSEEDWAKSVEHGSRYTYDLSKKRKTALESIGVEDEAFILDLDRGQNLLQHHLYAA